VSDLSFEGYSILDPRPIAEEAPYTFFLPAPEEKAQVGIGDLVQIMFAWEGPILEYGVERMWVTIISQNKELVRGTLESTPYEPDRLKTGEVIEFRRDDIIGIVWAAPEAAPSPSHSREVREYWERCLVDASVLEEGVPVEYVYREEPDMTLDGDKYPDSGWRIRARVDPDAPEEPEPTPRYTAIGAVLNADDSWLPLIDSPVGCAFMRDFATGKYVPVERVAEEEI
jgi:hypothetical protein